MDGKKGPNKPHENERKKRNEEKMQRGRTCDSNLEIRRKRKGRKTADSKKIRAGGLTQLRKEEENVGKSYGRR